MSVEYREGGSPDQSPQDAMGKTRAADTSRAADVTPSRQRRRARRSASLFLERLERLGRAAVDRAVHAWRAAITEEPDTWFSAENALADAIRASGMHAEQEQLLEQLLALFRRAGWFRPPQFGTTSAERPGTMKDGSEASAQYVTTIGLLAVLVRDRLSTPVFDLLYKPFAELIPTNSSETDEG